MASRSASKITGRRPWHGQVGSDPDHDRLGTVAVVPAASGRNDQFRLVAADAEERVDVGERGPGLASWHNHQKFRLPDVFRRAPVMAVLLSALVEFQRHPFRPELGDPRVDVDRYGPGQHVGRRVLGVGLLEEHPIEGVVTERHEHRIVIVQARPRPAPQLQRRPAFDPADVSAVMTGSPWTSTCATGWDARPAAATIRSTG